MDNGLDFTAGGPSGSQMKAGGYEFCCRYVAPASWKRLTKSEAQDKTAHGVRVVSNYEDSARPTDSFANGVQDAREALLIHEAAGGPDWAPIYFSVDYEVAPSGYKPYFRGINSVIGVERTGCYGEDALIRNLTAAGILGKNDSGVHYGWRSMSTAFPGGSSTVDCALKQTGGGRFAGHSVDFDQALTNNYGGWLIGEVDPNVAAVDVWKEDIIPNPAGRVDSPKHTPPGKNPTTTADYALGDVWDRVIKLQAAVDQILELLNTPKAG